MKVIDNIGLRKNLLNLFYFPPPKHVSHYTITTVSKEYSYYSLFKILTLSNQNTISFSSKIFKDINKIMKH